MKQLNFEQFVNSYLATAAWVTADSDECNDFTKDARLIAGGDCQQFIDMVIETFGETKGTELLTTPGDDLTYLAPHDFFLTRNHHGAGFWDKEEIYGEDEAKKLTEISHRIGEIDCIHVRGKKSKLTFA